MVNFLNSSETCFPPRCLFGKWEADHIQTHRQTSNVREAGGLGDSSSLLCWSDCLKRSNSNENRSLKTPPWAAQLSQSRCVCRLCVLLCKRAAATAVQSLRFWVPDKNDAIKWNPLWKHGWVKNPTRNSQCEQAGKENFHCSFSLKTMHLKWHYNVYVFFSI